MAYKLIQAKFQSNCNNCNRVLREHWDIVFDDIERKAYCTSCAVSLGYTSADEIDAARASRQAEGEPTGQNGKISGAGSLVSSVENIGVAVEALSGFLTDATGEIATRISQLEAAINGINENIAVIAIKLDGIPAKKSK